MFQISPLAISPYVYLAIWRMGLFDSLRTICTLVCLCGLLNIWANIHMFETLTQWPCIILFVCPLFAYSGVFPPFGDKYKNISGTHGGRIDWCCNARRTHGKHTENALVFTMNARLFEFVCSYFVLNGWAFFCWPYLCKNFMCGCLSFLHIWSAHISCVWINSQCFSFMDKCSVFSFCMDG